MSLAGQEAQGRPTGEELTDPGKQEEELRERLCGGGTGSSEGLEQTMISKHFPLSPTPAPHWGLLGKAVSSAIYRASP